MYSLSVCSIGSYCPGIKVLCTLKLGSIFSPAPKLDKSIASNQLNVYCILKLGSILSTTPLFIETGSVSTVFVAHWATILSVPPSTATAL